MQAGGSEGEPFIDSTSAPPERAERPFVDILGHPNTADSPGLPMA
jgi:hypothetical protein